MTIIPHYYLHLSFIHRIDRCACEYMCSLRVYVLPHTRAHVCVWVYVCMRVCVCVGVHSLHSYRYTLTYTPHDDDADDDSSSSIFTLA